MIVLKEFEVLFDKNENIAAAKIKATNLERL